MKPVHFVGTARKDLRGFPASLWETVRFQLYKVQQEKEPYNLEADADRRPEVQELRVRDERGHIENCMWPNMKRETYEDRNRANNCESISKHDSPTSQIQDEPFRGVPFLRFTSLYEIAILKALGIVKLEKSA